MTFLCELRSVLLKTAALLCKDNIQAKRKVFISVVGKLYQGHQSRCTSTNKGSKTTFYRKNTKNLKKNPSNCYYIFEDLTIDGSECQWRYNRCCILKVLYPPQGMVEIKRTEYFSKCDKSYKKSIIQFSNRY